MVAGVDVDYRMEASDLMPTTDHGLIYPDEDGNLNIWEHVQNLATSAEAALAALEAFASWTPTFLTGPTVLGSGGVSEGFTQRIGKLVHAEFRVELGTGFTWGSGTVELVLPFPAFVWGGSGLQASVGSWLLRDDGGPQHYAGTIGIFGPTSTTVSFGGAWDAPSGPPNIRVDSTDPITPAAGDVLSGVLDYRAA